MRPAESNRSVGYFTSMCTPDGTGGDDAIDGSNNAFGTAKFLCSHSFPIALHMAIGERLHEAYQRISSASDSPRRH